MASMNRAETLPELPPSFFDPIDPAKQPIVTNDQAILAAVVALAKDMEFIGRGGFLLPDMGELSKYVKMCVPRIVRGEYIDSYFIKPIHCQPFYSLKGKGFEAVEEQINDALTQVQPIYEAILENISKQKTSLVKK